MTVFGSERSRPTHWLKTGLAQARRVGRVEARLKHQRFVGSGFLVEGSLFGQAFSDLPLFLTCRHVIAALISADPTPASAPDLAVLFEGMFEERSSRVTAKCHHVLMDSPVEQLNYALLLLDCWPGTVAELILAPRRLEPGEKVFVIKLSVRRRACSQSRGQRSYCPSPCGRMESSAPSRRGPP